ncbi:myosin-11-like [Dicentrarchus labrax]|uniref:myosin-11-like n=1 Tax=Dicentrarchus labrax TaxID=13489 RepID=UPI0021F53653|nr:myosin-11-like [Dicentrarchus labrax]
METSNENEVKTNLQSVIFEVEEIRKKLRKVREDADQRGREVPEEKSQIKWMNFRAKKKQWELDQRLEKTMRERDELEIVKIKIHGQREEVEQKLEDAATTIVTMGVMKANIEKAAAEISNIREEMLKVQRKMEENKEEVKKFMDKLNSMKAWVSKWIMTEPAIKQTFSVNTSKFQEPQKETHKDTLKDPTPGIVTDQEGAEDEITKDAMSLQQSITSEDQHQSDKIKDEEHMHPEHKQKQECHFFAVDIEEEQNVFLQVQTEIHEEILMDENQTELAIHLREKAKVEKQILKLKETEEKIKEQMEYALEDMQERNEEIKRLVMEINNLQSQRPETGGKVEEGVTGLLKETEQKYILRVNTNVFKHEIFKYIVEKEENGSELKQEVTDESDLMRMEFEEQKQSQEIDEGCYKKDPGSDDIQRLRAEIYKTQEIIRLVVLELENQAEESNINKDHKEEDGEVQRLLEDIKQFQELLKMVKTAMMQSEMDLKEEMNNMKWMKIGAKKQRRELNQRFEKTLRERDELDILRIKLQKLTEMTEQKLDKMAKVKKTMEKMAVKTRMKSEDVEITIKQTKVKQRQVEDLSCKIEATKQALENSYLFLSQERAGFEKFKAEIRQLKDRKSALENTERQNGNIRKHFRDETDTERDQMGKEIEGMENEIFRLRSENEKLEENIKMIKDSLDQKNGEIEQLKRAISQLVKQKTERKEIEIQVESENVRVARQQAEAEIHEMNYLRENTERQKWELDDKVHMTKKELREMELLKLELEIKKKENEQMFRKSMRKKQECETMWNEIQREKKILRRDTKKIRNELDQRLEKITKERDELEVLRIKLQRQKTELADEKQSIKDRAVRREHEKQSLEKKEVESIRGKAEMVNQSSKVTNSITDLENMSQKMHVYLEIIRGEMGILENVNAQLEKQVEGLKALQAENRTVRDKMSRVKSQIKMDLEKMTIQVKAERDEIVHIRADIQKQKQELEIRLEKIKTERREMEVLKSELEIKKRENQQMRKGIRKEQEVKNMWAEVKGEKAALKREKQKWGKELDQRLQRIIKERDELEIMKLKLQIEEGESKSGMKERFPTQTQKHWEIIQTCMERFKFMKKRSEDLNGAIKDEKQHMEAQAKIMTQAKEEMEDLQMEIKRKRK